MRIFILSVCYPPMIISGAKLIYDLAKELSALGHEVTVITLDEGQQVPIATSIEEGVEVVRIRSGKIRQASRVTRAISEIRLSEVIWKAGKTFFEARTCDLLVGYSPTIFWGGLSERLRALYGCRRYLILRDIFPQWAVDAGLLNRHGLVYWYFRRQELRLYRSFESIGIESAANLPYFSALRPVHRGVEVLYNWSKVEGLHRKSFGLRERFGLKRKVIFVYGGNLGVAQDMNNILRLATSVQDQTHLFFVLVGEGSEADRIGREIERLHLQNVLLLPPVPQEHYMEIIGECDVGLITLKKDLKTCNIPGKILGYMEMRKPTLASVNPGNELTKIIGDHEVGEVCINGDDAQLREAALRLAADPEKRKAMGERAFALLKEKFDVRAAAKQILSQELVAGPSKAAIVDAG